MRVSLARVLLGPLLAGAMIGCREEPAIRDPSAPITPLPLATTALERADGRLEALAAARGVTLLHFWATWCAPCRRELPALRQAADSVEGVRLIAVSNEPWADLSTYFGGDVPPSIARDPTASLSRALGVSTLPETYVVDSSLVARRRIAGAIDWSDPAVRSWLAALAAEDR